jgi:hypothetical protein
VPLLDHSTTALFPSSSINKEFSYLKCTDNGANLFLFLREAARKKVSGIGGIRIGMEVGEL